MQDRERDKSEFNMAVSYLNRINYSFYIANEASRLNNAHAWFMELNILYRELSTELNEDEIKEFDKMFSDVSPEVSHCLKLSKKGMNQIPQNTFKKLSDIELKLRETMKKSGLQHKVKDDPRFAL